MKFKKSLLALGSLSAVIVPVTTIVACGESADPQKPEATAIAGDIKSTKTASELKAVPTANLMDPSVQDTRIPDIANSLLGVVLPNIGTGATVVSVNWDNKKSTINFVYDNGDTESGGLRTTLIYNVKAASSIATYANDIAGKVFIQVPSGASIDKNWGDASSTDKNGLQTVNAGQFTVTKTASIGVKGEYTFAVGAHNFKAVLDLGHSLKSSEVKVSKDENGKMHIELFSSATLTETSATKTGSSDSRWKWTSSEVISDVPDVETFTTVAIKDSGTQGEYELHVGTADYAIKGVKGIKLELKDIKVMVIGHEDKTK